LAIRRQHRPTHDISLGSPGLYAFLGTVGQNRRILAVPDSAPPFWGKVRLILRRLPMPGQSLHRSLADSAVPRWERSCPTTPQRRATDALPIVLERVWFHPRPGRNVLLDESGQRSALELRLIRLRFSLWHKSDGPPACRTTRYRVHRSMPTFRRREHDARGPPPLGFLHAS
jgi:hypothetical protein